jgi:hypothetical protein
MSLSSIDSCRYEKPSLLGLDYIGFFYRLLDLTSINIIRTLWVLAVNDFLASRIDWGNGYPLFG